MNRYYKLINLRSLLTALGSLFLLASCSSYQYAGYDNDGIYTSSRTGEAYTANDYEESYENALYYKNLFGEKAEQFAAVPEEGAIFTDVESYSSGEYDDQMFGEEGLAYEPGRAAWGSDPDEISINIYNNYSPYHGYPYYGGFYDPYWGPYYGYYPRYSYRYGYGYPYYGYGYPFAYHSWGWNIGWSYGWGSYYNHRYSPYYYNPYFQHNRRDVAYSSTRRTYSADNNYRQTRNDNRVSRIQSYSNTRNVRAAGTNRSDARTYQTRTVRASVPERRSNDSYRTSTQRREVQTTRPAPTRSTNQVRPTRSSGNNNSTYRSSSSSNTRSSGTTTSRSSRGRGN